MTQQEIEEVQRQCDQQIQSIIGQIKQKDSELGQAQTEINKMKEITSIKEMEVQLLRQTENQNQLVVQNLT